MKKQVMIVVVLFCIAFSAYGITVAAQRYTEATTEYEAWLKTREVITITVLPGDSIDGYWVEYAPDWMTREQYRHEIQTLNDMDSCTIYAGDTIKLYMKGGE